ncbi:cytochrome P450 [Mucidula mucida]|nr:cytochrome P450 [Mucidula mucida]
MSVLNGGSDSRASPLKFYRPQWTQHYIITRLDSDPTQVSHVHIHALSPDLCSGGVFISTVPTTHLHRPRQRPTLPFLALRYRLSSLHIVILSLNGRCGWQGTGLSYSTAQLPNFRWQDQYGGVVRIRAPLGEDRLFITDPKAIQYIYHTANYRFPKPTGRQAIMRSVFGPGLTTSEGDDHRRARKIMLPGFNGPEARTYLPIFLGAAERLAHKWEDLIAVEAQQTAVVSIPWWVSRAALDAIGEAAFDYQFGALDDSCNELVDMYTNLFFNVFGIPTTGSILTVGIVDKLAPAVVNFFLKYLPPRRLSHAFEALKVSTAVSKMLSRKRRQRSWKTKAEEIFFIISQANNSEDQKQDSKRRNCLRRCTPSSSQATKQRQTRSHSHFTKCARSQPSNIVFEPKYALLWVPECDEVIPLLDSITLDTGEVITELPIAKGTKIITSVAAYNRNKTIFGYDADVFNPDRWLRDDRPMSKISLGVYANLMAFRGSGITRLLVQLVGKFEFEFAGAADAKDFRREACNLMTPTLTSDRAKGSQLPDED